MFSVSLKMHRERLGLTQTEIGALLPDLAGRALPLRTVQRWEAGDRVPPGFAQTLILQRLTLARHEGGHRLFKPPAAPAPPPRGAFPRHAA